MIPRLVITALTRCRPCVARVAFAAQQERSYAIKVKELLKPEASPVVLSEAVKATAGSEHPVEKILNEVDVSSVDSAFQAFLRLGEIPQDAKKVLSEEGVQRKFDAVCEAIDKDCHRVNRSTLHRAIQACVALGLPEDARVVACLENELLWNLRKCNFRFLVQIAPFYADLQRTELERRLNTELAAAIQRRWVEVASLKDVLKLTSSGEKYSQEFLSRLDDRAVELAASASPGDLQKMVCSLAKSKRRPGPLLRALCYHLARQELTLTPRQMADLVSALHAVSFPDQPLLDRISTDLKVKLPEVTSLSVIRSLVTSVGLLRWRNTGLIDTLCEWLVSRKTELKPQEKISVLHTLAVVNYLPGGVEDVLLSDFNNQSTIDSLSTQELLTFVWAAVLLQRGTSEWTNKLFDRLSRSQPSLIPGDLLKVLNVTQFARISKIPVPPAVEKLAAQAVVQRSADNEAFSLSVLHALTHLVPKPKYLQEPGKTSFGMRLDAEFVVNEAFEPVPLEQLNKSPMKLRKVALLCWNYPDYCLASERLTGYSAFIRRCCKQSGYVIFDVAHSEFDRKAKIVAKVQSLQKKLKSLKGKAGILEEDVSATAAA